MSNKCPKCQEKLSPLYMKQTCPKCNTNLVYYDLENRLKADHEKAMKEQETVDRVLNNIKTSAFGGTLQIIRFVLMFSPLLWMCLPVFKANDGEDITLISVIMGIINGSFDFSDSSYLFPVITMVCIIIFSLMVIISSLFSVGEKALKRTQIFEAINSIVLLICVVLCYFNNAVFSYGVALVLLTYAITGLLHIKIDKKLNK
ncbi:MAG: hypothetical protein IJZ16_04410 [Clostridia bacterium]|nr:hypothetical protein [Clostridia bacterium]